MIPSDKFDSAFIKFMNKHFNPEEQYFILTSSDKKDNEKEKLGKNIKVIIDKIPKINFSRYILMPYQIIKMFSVVKTL